MKVELTLKSAKGFMDQKKVQAPYVKDALDKVLPWLDSLPDRIEDVPTTDWNEITIVITR